MATEGYEGTSGPSCQIRGEPLVGFSILIVDIAGLAWYLGRGPVIFLRLERSRRARRYCCTAQKVLWFDHAWTSGRLHIRCGLLRRVRRSGACLTPTAKIIPTLPGLRRQQTCLGNVGGVAFDPRVRICVWDDSNQVGHVEAGLLHLDGRPQKSLRKTQHAPSRSTAALPFGAHRWL